MVRLFSLLLFFYIYISLFQWFMFPYTLATILFLFDRKLKVLSSDRYSGIGIHAWNIEARTLGFHGDSH